MLDQHPHRQAGIAAFHQVPGYIWDADFEPAFIKICTNVPYPIKARLNNHECAKRPTTQAAVGFTNEDFYLSADAAFLMSDGCYPAGAWTATTLPEAD